MRLASLLHTHHIVADLRAATLGAAVWELLQRVDKFRPGVPLGQIREAVLRRETQSSTALSKGVALPHARIPELRDFYILFGVAPTPLQEKGLDGQAVDLVFLLLSNDRKSILMLQSMAAIARLCENESNLAALRRAPGRDDLWKLINDTGITVKKVLQACDLMTEACVRVRTDMRLGEMLDLLFEAKVNLAVVLSPEEEIVGAVTSEEIIDAGFPDYLSRLPNLGFLSEFEPFEEFFKREAAVTVGEIMNRKPLMVEAKAPVIELVFRLKQERQQFALVHEEGKFLGIVDRNDLISKILRP